LDEFDRNWIVAGNLSPSTMVTADFQDLIRDIDLHRLAFQVAEHQRLSHYDTLCTATTALRKRGALISIDDAGAGYASFRHLLKLNPDGIKLDITLTRD